MLGLDLLERDLAVQLGIQRHEDDPDAPSSVLPQQPKAAAFGSRLTEAEAPVERLIAAGLECDSARYIARSGALGAAGLVIPIPAVAPFEGSGAGRKVRPASRDPRPRPSIIARSASDMPRSTRTWAIGRAARASSSGRRRSGRAARSGRSEAQEFRKANFRRDRAAAMGIVSAQRSPLRPSSGGSGMAPSLRLRRSRLWGDLFAIIGGQSKSREIR